MSNYCNCGMYSGLHLTYECNAARLGTPWPSRKGTEQSAGEPASMLSKEGDHMLPNYVLIARDFAVKRCHSRKDQREFMFQDLLELESYDLMQKPGWRTEWLATGALPHGIPTGAVDRVWRLIDEALPEVRADDDEGSWVTINGAHVFIKDGIIEKGPKEFIGKSPDQLGQGGDRRLAWTGAGQDRFAVEMFDGEGNSIGNVDVLTDLDNGKTAQTENLEIWKEYQGKGEAKTMYKLLFADLKDRGFTKVQSSEMLKEGGAAVWNSLQKEGLPIYSEGGHFAMKL